MGAFRVTIEAVGGHGCDRTAKEGETLQPCGRQGCVDCEARALVAEYSRRCAGNIAIDKATLTHWPSDLGCSAPNDIIDDLLAKKRISKSFAG